MPDNIYNKLKTIKLWNLLWISLILSEVFTAIMDIIMGLIWYGRIDIDLLLIGSVVAFVVALFVSIILILIFREIRKSERHSEEAVLRAKEEWELTFNSMTDLIMILDTEHKVVRTNKAMAYKLGLTTLETVGITCYEYVHGLTGPPSFCPHLMCMLDGQEHSAEVYEERLGGHYLVTVTPLFDVRGEVVGSVHTAKDISKRMQAEKALRESEKFLQTIIETEPECIKLLAADGALLQMNRAGLSMIEAGSLDQVKGQCMYPLVVPEYREAFKSLTEDVFKGKSGMLEFEAIGLKGSRIRLETHAVPLLNDRDAIVALLGITRDITGRKEAEEKIRHSEAFSRNILDTVDEGFIVIDRDFRILTANKAYCGQVGESCESVIGRHCYEVSHKTLRPCHEEGEECAVLQVFETGEPHTALHKHPDAKGSILYVETKAFPIKDSTGAVTSVIETVNNITEKHLLEEEQLKTQKLESIGTLAGGIAHDFNNLLQGVFGYISLAKMNLAEKGRSLTMLQEAEKALHMSVNLTTQLLTFSKGGKPVKRKIQLKPVTETSARFALSGSSVDLRIKFDEDLWPVDADEGQIGQVIQNLVLNAEQAMPMGGTIVITARNVSSCQKELPPVLKPGNYVVISIKDSGTGIPEQFLPKIFDPYFTTKDKGSGLGLATSYSIIKNHGGVIDVKSKVGEGAIFFVYLPAAETMETSTVPVFKDIRSFRKGRILLMDDEDIVRNIAGDMLRVLGHEVELAEDGRAAIDKYRESMRSGKQFDIVIMDLTIRGGMGGGKAIKELLAIDPDIKTIVSSGYSDDVAMSEFATYGFKARLSKPYRLEDLRDTLNSLMG